MIIKSRRTLFLVLALCCIVRFFNLDADPSVFKNTMDIHDEAWWADNAKSKICNDSWISGDYAGGIAVAPLNSVITYVFFKLFGVSFFSLRLIPSLAASGIIFLLYLLIARYDKNTAAAAALLLAVNHSFFMYSRIGHVEMLTLFFIVAMFYCMSFRNRFFMSLGGICWALALLSKISVLVFTPVIFFFLARQIFLKKIKIIHFVFFIVGSSLPLLGYYVFVYIPHAAAYASQFEMTGKLMGVWNIHLQSVLMRIVFLPMSEYFMEPSVALLLLFSGCVLVKVRPWEHLFSRNRSLPVPVELSFLWVVLTLAVLFFIDFNDRRFTILIIPISILSGYLIAHRPDDERKETMHASVLILSFLHFLSLIGLHLHLHLKEYLGSTLKSTSVEGMNEEIVNYLFVLFTVLFIIASIVLVLKYGKRHRIYAAILYWSVIAFLGILLVNTVIGLKNNGLITDNKAFLIAMVLLVMILYYSLIFKNKIKSLRLLVLAYFVFNVIAIGKDIFLPTYSVESTAQFLNTTLQVKKNELIIGKPVIFELSLPTGLKPLYHSVIDLNDSSVITSQAKYKPKWYGTANNKKGSEDHLHEKKFVEENLHAKSELIQSFGLYPVNGIPRDTFFLYRMIYDQ